jgi:hypothetical protein
MNPQFFAKSAMGKAWEAQQAQPFGKDNLSQTYTTEPTLLHVLLPVLKSGFLTPKDKGKLCKSSPPIRKLYQEHKRVRHVDWTPLLQSNPNWQTQMQIDDHRVDMRMALLFHYNMDLAAVQRHLGGNHVGAHRDSKAIVAAARDLLDPTLLEDLRRVLEDGAPAKFNTEGTHAEFEAMRAYGNHPSLEQNLPKVMETMNKEDRKDHVLTFPAWLAPFIPHLMLNPNGLVVKLGKNDRLVFDASFMLNPDSRPFNLYIDLANEPDIVFGEAWNKFLAVIYNLRITFPDLEIYLFDDDIASAFRQVKYHPNVISAKGFVIGEYLFIATGLTFGDASSPPNFEPIARARMAVSHELSKGARPVPDFPEYIGQVRFTSPPPPGFQFAKARPDRFNPGVELPTDGSVVPTEYNMHVDDNLYAAAGVDRMKWAMRCSIAGLQAILGDNDPAHRPCQPDLDKFLSHPVSFERRQLGYVTNTRTMTVTIPEDKRTSFLALLRTWGSGSRRSSFTLREAAELLGVFIYLCRVCHWGIFLFQNLHHTMTAALSHNARRLWHSPEFRELLAQRSVFSHHPTDCSRYRFFSRKVSRAIFDCNSKTFLTIAIRQEVDFVIKVLSNPATYWWGSPIAHLIKREHDGEAYQDACPRGAGGFSQDFQFWWTVQWPDLIYQRTLLSPTDPSYISNNLLEYAALLFGLAGTILAWEALPVDARPSHPIVLLWTDNTTARAWTKRISGIKSPLGRSLARILAHLLMFSDLGIESQHIEGIENVVADFLSRLFESHHFSAFTYQHLQTRFPWLRLSHRFLPSNELLALVFTALSRPYVDIPTTRVELGLLRAEPSTSSQNFFGIPK